jgi:hypothetical protein
MRHLSGGMNPCIRSSGSNYASGLVEDPGQYGFDFLLYRSLVWLPLPPMKMSAQVLNDQGNSLGQHRRIGGLMGNMRVEREDFRVNQD